MRTIVGIVALLLVSSSTAAQTATKTGIDPAYVLEVNGPDSGVFLVSTGSTTWAECRIRDKETNQEKTKSTTCRVIEVGAFTSSAASDRVVLCKECDPNANPVEVEDVESIVGIITSSGIPVWASQSKWYEDGGFEHKNFFFADINLDHRTEMVITQSEDGLGGCSSWLSILAWNDTARQMKEVFSKTISQSMTDPETGEPFALDSASAVDIVCSLSPIAPCTIVVTEMAFKNGVWVKKKGETTFFWKPQLGVYGTENRIRNPYVR